MNRNVYEGDRLNYISFPLGGIGTGCIGLSGTGRLIDWEIFNGPNKFSMNGYSHFAVKTEKDGKVIDARVLNGDITDMLDGRPGGSFGHGVSCWTMAGFPHFRNCVFTGEFPIAQIEFSDPDFPGKASLTAFNPFIPLNSEDSSLPAAMFEFTITNTGSEALDYTISAVLKNPGTSSLNSAFFENGMSAVFLDNEKNEKGNPESVDMTLATPDTENVSVQEYWLRGMWLDHIETYWREFSSPGFPTKRTYSAPGTNDHSTLFVRKTVAPGASAKFRFAITWNRPCFTSWWDPMDEEKYPNLDPLIYNYYTYKFADSSKSAAYVISEWDRLYGETVKFRDALFSSTLPEEVTDAVQATISVLKSPTCLRIGEKGDFYGWEGLNEHMGSCQGTCSHVWNYVYATCFLFPDLERNIRETDYRYNQQPSGEMSFRLKLPFGREPGTNRGCVDGQMGGVMKVYREWLLSGDDEWLRGIWDKVKRSLEFAWSSENGDRWDEDCDGVLEGRQHHTLDMELFGPSSWLEGFYLGALKAGAVMARYLGFTEDAEKYEALFEKGKAWTKENLFNGEYFYHRIDLNDRDTVEKYCAGTVDVFGNDAVSSYWHDEIGEIKYQIGEGCEIDQLVAQWHADILGLGDLFDPEQVDTALRSMFRYNFKKSMRNVVNPFRVFSLNDESGAIMCDFPEGKRKPKLPILDNQETMHGFEYSFAGLLLSRGFIDEGLTVIRSVRDRYDGRGRNPWNEIECGANYARSMSSFSFIPILSGMSFDAVHGHLGFKPYCGGDFRSFWSSGTAWGTVDIRGGKVSLEVLGGKLKLNTFAFPGAEKSLSCALVDGAAVSCRCENGCAIFDGGITVEKSLVIG